MTYGNSEDGNWTKCDACGVTYSDADGGCECMYCRKCETIVEDDDDLDADGLCEDCAADIEASTAISCKHA